MYTHRRPVSLYSRQLIPFQAVTIFKYPILIITHLLQEVDIYCKIINFLLHNIVSILYDCCISFIGALFCSSFIPYKKEISAINKIFQFMGAGNQGLLRLQYGFSHLWVQKNCSDQSQCRGFPALRPGRMYQRLADVIKPARNR